MPNSVIHITNSEQTLRRIDKLIATMRTDLSRSRVESLIKQGAIRVNGELVRPSYLPRLNDTIEIAIPDLSESILPKAEVPFTEIYRDEDIIVIDKPVGVVTHPAPGHRDDTLVNGLLARYPTLSGINGVKRPGIVHRIDKDTSGLLVVAVNDVAHRHLAKQLVDHSMHREYIALVKGVITETEGIIDAPIGRDQRYRQKMAVNLRLGKEAKTNFKVISRFSGYTLLAVRLETGRTHQIRVHLSYILHPIVGDPLYGGKDPLYKDGQLLHAHKLMLTHPHTGEKMTFECRLPPHFINVLEKLQS
ncbi:MAG TPA: RluA family pseudouridine synthase [Bacilli bacterium]|nr:RluA family pseudouridine synthase [Bacilli bacterium]